MSMPNMLHALHPSATVGRSQPEESGSTKECHDTALTAVDFCIEGFLGKLPSNSASVEVSI